MDRSLGAKESANIDLSLLEQYIDVSAVYLFWKDGLFYQRGRKDPLNINVNGYGDDDFDGDLTETNSNPNTFDTDWKAESSWVDENNEKSAYDPCPAGYRVPSETV